MVMSFLYYPQDAVALFARSLRHVAQRLFAAQANLQDFSGLHAFEAKLGPNEGHRTHFAGDVDGMPDR